MPETSAYTGSLFRGRNMLENTNEPVFTPICLTIILKFCLNPTAADILS